MTSHKQTILMCPPDHFQIAYVINPWMEGQFASTNDTLVQKQWNDLRSLIEQHANVVLEPAQPQLPDIVFTANAGLLLGNKVIVSRFRSAERQGEEKHNDAWFRENGFEILEWPQDVFFEGAGDALFDRGQPVLWVGHGFRSDAAVPAILQERLDYKTVALNLVDPRFYHLDTCLCPLTGGFLLYFPAAFDDKSRASIEALIPPDKRIPVEEADALKFCCNAVDLGAHIVMNDASDDLQRRLHGAGFQTIISPLSEFMKAGGAAKCLTLKLAEP